MTKIKTPKSVVKMTHENFIVHSHTINPNVQFSAFEIEVVPKMNKGGRAHSNLYYGNVTKLTNSRILIGAPYEIRMEKLHPGFKVGKNNVFDKHLNVFIGENTELNRFYLKYEWFDSNPPQSKYMYKGSELDKKLLAQWLIVPPKPSLFYQTVNIKNIRKITIDHIEYDFT